MIKQLLTVASFGVGGAGALLIGHLANTPAAFTPEPVSVVVIPVTFAGDIPVAVEPESSLVAPVVTAAPVVRKPAKAPVPAETNFEACSDWTVVGAQFVEPGGATGVRSVRTLCATPANAAPR